MALIRGQRSRMTTKIRIAEIAGHGRANFGETHFVNSQGKRHRDVLRSIERMKRSEHAEIAEHYGRNFAPVDFVDAKGERRPMYRMTADGVGAEHRRRTRAQFCAGVLC